MPHTIKENLARLQAAKTAIGNAIMTKGGTVSSGDGLEEFAADIATIPSGGGSSSNDVNFYDYDGTIVQSYSADEFANLSELPTNPTHEGLTAQGWNWSLADAKTYVAKYRSLNIGQMYITSDGKTRLYITLPDGRTSPILQLYLNDNSELDIDWGDESTHSTFTATTADYKSERHEYSTPGDYVITITVVSGGFALQSLSTSVSSVLWNGNNSTSSPDRAYNNAIKKIEMGDGIANIGNSAFNKCQSLSSITIPNSVTIIDDHAFDSCYSLSSITIPDGITSIANYTFNACYSLSSITIPNSVTIIDDHVFYSCYSLSSITIPDGITSIANYTFYGCRTLSSITIPDDVTIIGDSAFDSCYSLSSITIPDGVTSIGNSVFFFCQSLSSITIPDGVTSIGSSVFYNCYSLSSITIPDGITSIHSGLFYECQSLSSITIPDGVTSIEIYAFYGCSYMSYIKFESTTPPTIVNSYVWIGLSTSTKILVPAGTLEAYKSATNYPDPSKYTYEEY